MTKLAFGDNIKPLSFYEPLILQPSTTSGIATESSKEIIFQQNNVLDKATPTNTNNNEEMNNERKLSGETKITTSVENSIKFKNYVDLLLTKNTEFDTSTNFN